VALFDLGMVCRVDQTWEGQQQRQGGVRLVLTTTMRDGAPEQNAISFAITGSGDGAKDAFDGLVGVVL
jgi:hypothetical protein